MDFVVDRRDLRRTRCVAGGNLDRVDLAPGQVLLRVEEFGFTANNVTYGVVGEAIGYWQFFPAEEGWGRIPVWGIGTVARSRHEGLAEGRRVYGYLPMSTHLVVQPAEVSRHGFVDASPHRAALPPIYNQYTLVENEPGYRREDEDRLMLLRPLFATAFLLDDFLAENAFFGAGTVVLSSASSKTALALAFQLRRNRRGTCEVIGLTSPRNAPFVQALGCHDRVVPYGEVGSLAVRPIVFVDMAGDRHVLHDVHHHFGTEVRHSCQVGLTHWEQTGQEADLPGAEPQFFFAPSQVEKRRGDWGPEGFQRRLADAWGTFLAGTSGWFRVVRGRGPEAVERVYRDAVEGRLSPDEGHVLSLWGGPG